MKKSSGLLLSGILAASLMSAAAIGIHNKPASIVKAEVGTGKIIVGGTDLVEDSDHTVEGTGGGTAKLTYNEDEEPVITLDNYVYSGWGYSIYAQHFYGIYLNDVGKTVYLELKGNNSITLDYPYTQKWNSYGIFSDYTNLVINGGNSDTLTLNADSAPRLSIGLWSRGTVTTTINGGTINANANTGGERSIGVFTEASATYPGDFIMNGGTLNAKGAQCTYDGNDDRYTSYGFWGNGVRLTLNGGTINATGGTTSCNISVSAGIGAAHAITLNGGVLNAYGAKDNGSFKSYGIRNAPKVVINDKVKQVILAGATGTYTGTITNNVPGNGYDNYDGTGEATIIPAKTAFNTYKRALFKNIGAMISGYEGTYDNANHSISITDLDPNTAVVRYGTEEGTYNLTSAPSYKEPGTYTTYYKITADGYTDKIGSATVKINKIANSWTTTPVFATDLVYDGSSHPLITDGGAVESGTIKYKVGDGEYGTDIPEAINAGTYSLRATVEVDDYHNQPVDVIGSVTIAQAENSIVEPVVGVSGLVYDGQSHPLVEEGFEAEHGDVYFSLSETGEYTKDIPTATDAGTYTVYYKVISDDPNYEDIAVEHFDVVIAKSTNEYKTIPSSKTDLIYTGSPITLVNAGEANGGKILYKLGDGEYSEELPTATDAGTYTIYYKVLGAPNYEDIAEQSFTVTIAKANAVFEKEPTAVSDLGYTGQAQALVNAGLSNDGEVQYSLSQDGPFSSAIPSASEAGEYTVYYKIVGDKNHNDSEVKYVKVSIASRETLVDDESGVKVETKDGTSITPNINLKVEVRTSVKAEKGSADYKAIQKMLAKNEKISNVFEIKLIKTEGDVETEIQPSDIKEGMKLIIHIDLPEGLKTDGLKILHIHNSGEMEFIENYEVANNEVVFEVSSLSELAFVTRFNAGLPGGIIALIVIGSLLLLLGGAYALLFFVFNKWINKDGQAVRVLPFALGEKDGKKRVIAMPFKFEYREENEIYKSKDEALKAQD